MAIINSIKRQLRSVITWDNPNPNLIFSQWTENGDEIKNASKLIIGPGPLNVNQPVAFFAIIYEMNFIKLLDILLC